MRLYPAEFDDQPIVGLATPPGRSGVAVIRISGRDFLKRITPLLRLPSGDPFLSSLLAPRALIRVDLMDPEDDAVLDRIMAVHFPGPRSFTGEDVLELQGHGSPAVVQRTMELLLEAGIRPALPGEFSRRAFLAGKMDLTQAEGLMQLVEASSLRAAKAAQRQMGGALAREVAAIRDQLIDILAHLEANLDFSDEEIEPDDEARLAARLCDVLDHVEQLQAGADRGRVLREGFHLAIAGRPNVGKSSLFNRLIGMEKAIVTDVPGTTRDLIENQIQVGGIPILLIDTAGIRQSDEMVERIGIDRAEKAIVEADGVLFVADASSGLVPEDQRILEIITDSQGIFIWTKIDLCAEGALPMVAPWGEKWVITLSCKNGQGLDKLPSFFKSRFMTRFGEGDDPFLLEARHQEALAKAETALKRALGLIAQMAPEEVVVMEVREALNHVGSLSGQVSYNELLDRIFGSFCIGK